MVVGGAVQCHHKLVLLLLWCCGAVVLWCCAVVLCWCRKYK